MPATFLPDQPRGRALPGRVDIMPSATRFRLPLVLGLWLVVVVDYAKSQSPDSNSDSTLGNPVSSGAATTMASTDRGSMDRRQRLDAAQMSMRLPMMVPLEVSKLPTASQAANGYIVADATGKRFRCRFQRLADLLDDVSGETAGLAAKADGDDVSAAEGSSDPSATATATEARAVSQAVRSQLSLRKWIRPAMPTRLGRDGRPTTSKVQAPEAATPTPAPEAPTDSHQDGQAVTRKSSIVNAKRDLAKLNGHCQTTTPG